MHEHLSRRAARRHDLGLLLAGIAAGGAAPSQPSGAWPRPRTGPQADPAPPPVPVVAVPARDGRHAG
ncbi:MAG: hypothetical protein ACREWI_17260 [Telluria sp.]